MKSILLHFDQIVKQKSVSAIVALDNVKLGAAVVITAPIGHLLHPCLYH
jgi:hypothetical protein